MRFIRSNFSDVYETRHSAVALSEDAVSASSDISYFNGSGFHLYSQLSLLQKLTAPQNTSDAAEAFEVIQRYVDIAEACAQKTGGRILEVQGERLHLFFEKGLNPNTLAEILVFCTAFTNTVYQQKSHLGNDCFNGFTICFDYGEAIILSTGNSANDSFVSLGPCANAPAKQLSLVSAPKTCMPTQIAQSLFPVDGRTSWYSINLLDRKQIRISNFDDRNYHDIISEAAKIAEKIYSPDTFTVRASRMFQNRRISYSAAELQQGFFMRADLHDFTKKVKEAFESQSPDKINTLLRDFTKVLQYGDHFIAATNRPVIQLPWAGDCANIFLLPKVKEDIDNAQTYYTAQGPANWLTGYDGKIEAPFKDAKWLVSICCGDESCGDRNVLVARVRTSTHGFLFATGWSVGNSQEAHGVSDSKAGDVLTSKIDYAALEEEYQDYFHEADTNFVRSNRLATLCSITKNTVPELTAQSQIIPEIVIATPKPRPYYCKRD